MLSSINSQNASSLYQNLFSSSKRTVTANANFMDAVSQVGRSSTPAPGTASTTAINKSATVSSTINLESLPEDIDTDKVLFAMFTTGGSLAVLKADDFSENNPTYIVKGRYNGKDYEEVINANSVNPSSASLTEMAALQTHLQKTGVIDRVDLAPFQTDFNGNPVERSYSEKIDFTQALKAMIARNLKANNPYYSHMSNLGKILSAVS